jgi:hypothetical protein
MIKAALAATVLCATMLVGNAQAREKDPPPNPCGLIIIVCGFPAAAKSQPSPVTQSGTKTQSVTPSIPIPPPVRSR